MFSPVPKPIPSPSQGLILRVAFTFCRTFRQGTQPMTSRVNPTCPSPARRHVMTCNPIGGGLCIAGSDGTKVWDGKCKVQLRPVPDPGCGLSVSSIQALWRPRWCRLTTLRRTEWLSMWCWPCSPSWLLYRRHVCRPRTLVGRLPLADHAAPTLQLDVTPTDKPHQEVFWRVMLTAKQYNVM